eukprot:scaffold110617_cov24-Tisochrysis_lutea.AAC.1
MTAFRLRDERAMRGLGGLPVFGSSASKCRGEPRTCVPRIRTVSTYGPRDKEPISNTVWLVFTRRPLSCLGLPRKWCPCARGASSTTNVSAPRVCAWPAPSQECTVKASLAPAGTSFAQPDPEQKHWRPTVVPACAKTIRGLPRTKQPSTWTPISSGPGTRALTLASKWASGNGTRFLATSCGARKCAAPRLSVKIAESVAQRNEERRESVGYNFTGAHIAAKLAPSSIHGCRKEIDAAVGERHWHSVDEYSYRIEPGAMDQRAQLDGAIISIHSQYFRQLEVRAADAASVELGPRLKRLPTLAAALAAALAAQ